MSVGNQNNGDQQSMGGSLAAAGQWVWNGMKAAYQGLFRDGALSRAGTQGLDELGQALVALPGSIHAGERDSVLTEATQNGVWGESQEAGSRDQSVNGNTRELADNTKSWVQREAERENQKSGGSDQNEVAKARILPEEEREQRKENERGR